MAPALLVFFAPVVNPPPRSHGRSAPARFRVRSRRGFSLLELSVTVFIVSLLAMLAVPALRQAQLGARSSAVSNDLRIFAAAFQTYAHAKADWPAADEVPGAVPSGMAPYLRAADWERPTPIGGHYTWVRDSLQAGRRYPAVLVIASVGENRVTADRNQLVDLDRKLDDGDLDTGNFRLGFRNQPVFVLEH